MNVMSQNRRPPGTVRDPIMMNLRVERATRTKLGEAAAACEMTRAELLDTLIQTMPLDNRGRPAWFAGLPHKEQLPVP